MERNLAAMTLTLDREVRAAIALVAGFGGLQLAAEGNSNKAIAGRLNLSTLTVETHRKRISEKLNLHGPADLILYAVRAGIIPAPPSI